MIRDSDWYEQRKGKLGGSDAAVVLGISPFKTPLKLWMEKRGESEPDDIDAQENVYWGTRLESLIAEEYSNRTGRQVVEASAISVHPHFPWMVCNVDRFVKIANHKIILEIKNVGVYASGLWGQEGTAAVPPYYYAQAQHNCEVTGSSQCDMPILVGGNQYRCYHVPRNPEFIRTLIQKERRFMNLIETGEKPEPINASDLEILFPQSKPETHKEGSEDAARAWAQLAIAKRNLKSLKAEAISLEFALKKEMGDSEHLSFEGVKLATWRTGKSGRRTFKICTAGLEEQNEPDQS